MSPATRAISGAVEDEVLRTAPQKMQHATAMLDRASAARAVNSPTPAFRRESGQLHWDRRSPELRAAQLPDFPARKRPAHSRGRELSIERCNLFSSRVITAFLRAKIEQQAQERRCQTGYRFRSMRAQ